MVLLTVFSFSAGTTLIKKKKKEITRIISPQFLSSYFGLDVPSCPPKKNENMLFLNMVIFAHDFEALEIQSKSLRISIVVCQAVHTYSILMSNRQSSPAGIA